MKRLFALLILLVVGIATAAERPTHDGKVVLFGDLHTHSVLSKDFKAPKETKSKQKPSAAFEYAKSKGLDFLAVTDHQQQDDGTLDNPYRMTPSQYSQDVFNAAKAIRKKYAGEFIAIPGFEWGVESRGNHIGVLGAKGLPKADLENKDYDRVYKWAADGNCDFIQFNHPKRPGKNAKKVKQYGEELYDPPDEFLKAVQPLVRTMAIANSVAKAEYKDSEEKTHRRATHDKAYNDYLNLGFHVSPTGDGDSHGRNWGTMTAARTAVWADAVTYKDLIKAIRANRVYATEDDEMVVIFQAEYGGKTYWMGETIPFKQGQNTVTLKVKVWQAKGSDGDPVDEGPYTVVVMKDQDGVGGKAAAKWGAPHEVGDEMLEVPLEIKPGQYFYVKVSEQNGKDNPIGDDRDTDMNDSAWTSPIWIGQ